MEHEIEKLKKEYLKITPPEFLKTGGVDNLWTRVDAVNEPFYARYSTFIMVGVIVLVALAGFIDATYAATPGSILYPVKKATQEVLHNIPVVSSVVKDSLPAIPPVPTATPTPMKVNIKTEDGSKNKENNIKNTEPADEQNGENPVKNIQEDVKGAETDAEGSVPQPGKNYSFFLKSENSDNKKTTGENPNTEKGNNSAHSKNDD